MAKLIQWGYFSVWAPLETCFNRGFHVTNIVPYARQAQFFTCPQRHNVAVFSTELVEICSKRKCATANGLKAMGSCYYDGRGNPNRIMLRVMGRELGAIPKSRTSGQLFAHGEIKMNCLRLKLSVRFMICSVRVGRVNSENVSDFTIVENVKNYSALLPKLSEYFLNLRF